MIPTTLLNAILSLAVMVMAVSPLVWAILTQHRDRLAAGGEGGAARAIAAPSTRSRPQRRSTIPSPVS